MLKIAICDDNNSICLEIEQIIMKTLKEQGILFEIDIFNSGESLYKRLARKCIFDIIFLDIEMEKLNGIQLGKEIRDFFQNEITKIIYISSYEEYCMDLFKVRPFDFIIKPFKEKDLILTLERAINLINITHEIFTYKKGHTLNKEIIKNIIYFESQGKEIKMVTVDKVVLFYGSLKEIFEQIEKYKFIYSHKSYLVNYNHIKEFKYEELIMTNNDIIPISQGKRKEIRNIQLDDFI